jgi:hypothetical protein
MKEATIHFEGEAFQAVKWDRLLRDMGFRLSGGAYERATHASGGNYLVAKSQGFIKREAQQSYEWQLTLKQTRRWEGTVKFYAVLLAAFVVPQSVKVALDDRVFIDAETLRAYAEAAILRGFGLEELMEGGVYRAGEQIQFL